MNDSNENEETAREQRVIRFKISIGRNTYVQTYYNSTCISYVSSIVSHLSFAEVSELDRSKDPKDLLFGSPQPQATSHKHYHHIQPHRLCHSTMLHHDYVDELLAIFAGDDGGGVRLCRDWVGRILQESRHSVNDAAMLISEHIGNGTHQLATVNEVIDVDANNRDDPPDVAAANADDDDATEEEDLHGRAKKSRTGGTPKKPSPPESERASFSTPTKGGGGNRSHTGGRGGIVDLVNSMGSAHINDTAADDDVPSEGVTLRRRDGEKEDSNMPPGADDDLKMPAEEADEVDGKLLFLIFLFHCLLYSLTTFLYIIIPVLLSTDLEEENSSTGPNDLPPCVIRPLRVITPADKDMSMLHGSAKDEAALKYIDFVRMGWAPFCETVSSKRRKADNKRSMHEVISRGGEGWLHADSERLKGFYYCRNEMLDFEGRVYFKSKDGLFYELNKSHWYLITKLYISRCKCKVDGVELRQIEERKIADYIAKIRAGEDPGIDESVKYGETKHVQEVYSKANAKTHQDMIDNGLVPAIAVYTSLENPLGSRFIDDLWKIVADAIYDWATFATPKKIVLALGGDHTNLPDTDVQKYRGCIITDLEALQEEIGCDSISDLQNCFKRYFKTASCNPGDLRNRGVKDGDVFVFHNDDFFGGDEGEQALASVKVVVHTFYENGKKKE